ncbi:hypothetical protein [Microseira sp. BLCC-F43]|jgi:hypothetical protein|uniref:hypothetical protein n=1 Tax=Microseira sp. BLCC-F43 TaxID=3153602 RepID=UPI0035B740E6
MQKQTMLAACFLPHCLLELIEKPSFSEKSLVCQGEIDSETGFLGVSQDRDPYGKTIFTADCQGCGQNPLVISKKFHRLRSVTASGASISTNNF